MADKPKAFDWSEVEFYISFEGPKSTLYTHYRVFPMIKLKQSTEDLQKPIWSTYSFDSFMQIVQEKARLIDPSFVVRRECSRTYRHGVPMFTFRDEDEFHLMLKRFQREDHSENEDHVIYVRVVYDIAAKPVVDAPDTRLYIKKEE